MRTRKLPSTQSLDVLRDKLRNSAEKIDLLISKDKETRDKLINSITDISMNKVLLKHSKNKFTP
jgi:hypothetical protein